MVNQIKNLSKNSLSSLFVNILNKAVEFVLYLVVAKYLGSVEFGKYIFIELHIVFDKKFDISLSYTSSISKRLW